MIKAESEVRGKTRESMTLVEPPSWRVGSCAEACHVKGEDGLLSGSSFRMSFRGAGTGRGKMYFCDFGMFAKQASGTPKFFASTSFGVWANHSVISIVWSSEKFPLSKTRRNSHPPSSP